MQSRRKFLHQIAATAIGVSLVNAAKSAGSNESEPKILRVALMGLGHYASIVADAMQQCTQARLTGLISGTPAKLEEWQRKYNVPARNCYNYQNFDSIKNNPDIDAVYVITPNGLHCEHTIRAAQAGKHVICEKPMAINADEGRKMIEACNKAGVKLLVGYRLHFEANTLAVVKMRQEGKLGKVLFFNGLSGFKIGDPNQWRLNKKLAGGGSMMDIGIYSINGARYMIGEEPAWVTAQETKTDFAKFKEGVDETITFQMGFPGGAVASCLSTYSMNNLDKFFLNGSDGFAELQPATGYGPIRGRSHEGKIELPHVTHQTRQMDEMAKIILEGKQPEIAVDGQEGLKDLKIIDAVYEAVKSGQRVSLKV